ncbi:PCI domain-containing protein [Golovinomyces cichoracearum]|uniref:PCI domain-containing protein n=1 Tax=Golovinomyces cichoracearum TaxID=62708 RepID=A0A420IZQ9_9PEZI|nr:PCI domain-containing protein [Golovinomyces cichoracearum]
MPIVDQYLHSIAGFLKNKDGKQLQAFLRVEPPLPHEFTQLSLEIKKLFPREAQEDLDGRNDRLDRYIEQLIPVPENETPESNDAGCAWPGFQVFLREYFKFWRDVDFNDLLMTHTLLSEVTYTCITTLSHPVHGIIVLPATVYLCSCLVKLTITLDKRPDLTARVRKVVDEGERKSLAENTAETIQRAFTICLTERTSNRNGITRDGRPESKKVEIYQFANMVLKLLYQCKKPRLASQIFTNILQNSPPLSIYTASERVTYLYYLGRYHFATNHFYYAQRCFEAAYNQCLTKFVKNRRLILVYLVSANIILGRFPSNALMSRPESADIITRFLPIMQAIRTGDIISFKKALGPESGNQQWFFQKGVFLPLLYRCEMLVWRSLARKVFLLTYQFPLDPNSRKAPTLDVSEMVAVAQYCQKILEGWKKPVNNMIQMQSGRVHPNTTFMKSADLISPPNGPKKLMAHEGLIFGNQMPDIVHIEAIIASLIQQGLVYGYLSHSQGKFAIIGSKQRGGPVRAGFPNVWETLRLKAEQEGKDVEIPGWVQKERTLGFGGVINLSGARPAGAD